MKIALIAALAIAAPALAQTDPSIPAGNPLDPGAAAVARAQDQAQEQARLRAEQVARANAIAAMQRPQPTPVPPADTGRRRVRVEGFGQPIGSAIGGQALRPPQPSPYFQFGTIRTPWEPH